ncbi:MAG TPA: triose-phosphate isomerase [Tepidisphaeraceae bacterium]|nr:triose-phosphate isomerase [Tepidisphaeraceae bacterium]
MRKPFIAGNWKMNTTKSSAIALAKSIASSTSSADIGIAPPFVYLDAVAQAITGSNVLLGAQDLYFEKDGAFTGEISATMLIDLGVKFVLVGHSERRHVLGEKSELLAKKAKAVLDAGLILVHCVGEKLEERDANQTLDVVRAQLKELPTTLTDAAKLVIAYEPVWAIGTGRVATDEQAQEVHAFIRSELTQTYGKSFADSVRIQYGGSVKPENAKGLLGQPDVDGALVGGASLKAESFLGIVNAV